MAEQGSHEEEGMHHHHHHHDEEEQAADEEQDEEFFFSHTQDEEEWEDESSMPALAMPPLPPLQPPPQEPPSGAAPPAAAASASSNTADTRHFYTFLSDKAGMDEHRISKEEVERIVYEASKNSKFFQAQQRNDVKIQERIVAIQKKLRTLNDPQRRALEAEADKRLVAAENACRSMSQVCVVVDLDAFFTSVEERDQPELRTVPFAVGGGVICTANYEARKYGVRSAMPLFIAKKLCPKLVVRPTRFETYSEVAEQTRDIFNEYDPEFRAGSLDEAYLDLSPYVQERAQAAGIAVPPPADAMAPLLLFTAGLGHAADKEEEEEEEVQEVQEVFKEDAGATTSGSSSSSNPDAYWKLAEEVVAEIRARIKATTGVTASAGIATSFCLAKIASNEKKPDGQFRVADVQAFLRDLPVRKVSGIGRITERCLVAGLDIHTCSQLYVKRALLYHVYTAQTAHWLLCRSVGLDGGGPADHEGEGSGSNEGRKGISRERTFAALSRKEDLLEKLRLLCDSLAADMAREGLKGKTVTLKLKNSDFQVTTRAKSCAIYVSTSQELYHHALALLLPQLPITLRLMGVRASHFQPKPQAPPKGQGLLKAYVSTEGNGSPAAAAAPRPPITKTYTCPLCARTLEVSLHEFNGHVDACLSKSDPRFRAREEEERKQRAPPPSLPAGGANKKAKRNGGGGGGKKPPPAAGRPLEHFFGKK